MVVEGYIVFMVIILGIWLYGNFSPSRRNNLKHYLNLDDDQRLADKALPQIALLCPGRNEATWITKTLPELCRQNYPHYQVVYIDDQSDDQTPQITKACGAEFDHLLVVRNQTDPPAGWVGKCWAIKQGYQTLCQKEAAQQIPPATWLCFTDADIHWDPDVLRHAMRHAQAHDADLVALFPHLECHRFVEALAQTTMVLALSLLYPFDAAMDPKNPNTLTSGAFILVRRSFYDKIQGHQAVAGCVVEDLALGKALKAAGAKIRIAMARDLLRCRMYESWADMWEGLTKNAYAGLGYRPWLGVAFILSALAINILLPVYVIGNMVWLANSGAAAAMASLAFATAALGLKIRLVNRVRKTFNLSWYHAFTSEMGAALYCLFVAASMWRYYRGGNIWKGRAYGPDIVKQQRQNKATNV